MRKYMLKTLVLLVVFTLLSMVIPPVSAGDEPQGKPFVALSDRIDDLESRSDDWDTAYSWGDHSAMGYLTSYTETDPIFSSSPAAGISTAKITNWDTAYGWGDHSAAGYLTSYTETDPVYSGSPAAGITAAKITSWDTAYGWGDHAAAGYDSTNDAWTGTGDVYTTSGDVGIGTTSPIGLFEVRTGNSMGPALLDQSQTTIKYYATNQKDEWQSFTAGKTGKLEIVSLYISTLTNPSETIRIYSGQGTGGTLLYTATGIYAPANAWLTHTLTTPIDVTSGSKYTIRLSTSSGSGCYWGCINTNPYSGGMASFGSSWDFMFKTYVSTVVPELLVSSNGNVGIGTTNPQGALDISSTTGALIVPRMTTAERDALTAINGMIIYNSATNKFNFYENGVWVTK